MGSPAELAEYNPALDRVIDLDPARLNPIGGGVDHPVAALYEAAHGVRCAAWAAGVAAGVQYEHMRLATLRRVMTRQPCHGHGPLRAGSPHRADPSTQSERCEECSGRRTVPVPAPRLPIG